jgi:murein DD-endopeptidase MepM/ murein hydrolase activator NlpD
MRLAAPAVAKSARMNGRHVRLFAASAGVEGLMPIAALDKPGKYALDFLAEGGAVLHSTDVTVLDARFKRQNVVLSKKVASLKAAPGEMETARAFRKTVTDVRYWSEPFQVPVPGCRTSPYGVARLVNSKLTGDYHAGIDQRGPAGEPVRAITGGVVRVVQPWKIHGNAVGIDHGQGVESMYLHLSRFAVVEGATVKAGDVVGYVGSTGRSTAPHLHWSLYVNGVPVNPESWVKLAACETAGAAK